MSIEKVREYLAPLGVAARVREFDVSSATVELAAVALGVDGARIAKSMGLKVGERAVIIVTAGDQKVNSGNCFIVVIYSHIKRLYFFWIVCQKYRLFVNLFSEVSFVF